MIAIPSLEEEDAKRPGRERDALVGERTRIINRFKSTLAWLGIRGFKPNLRNAAARSVVADAHHCIMVRPTRGLPNTSVLGAMPR